MADGSPTSTVAGSWNVLGYDDHCNRQILNDLEDDYACRYAVRVTRQVPPTTWVQPLPSLYWTLQCAPHPPGQMGYQLLT